MVPISLLKNLGQPPLLWPIEDVQWCWASLVNQTPERETVGNCLALRNISPHGEKPKECGKPGWPSTRASVGEWGCPVLWWLFWVIILVLLDCPVPENEGILTQAWIISGILTNCCFFGICFFLSPFMTLPKSLFSASAEAQLAWTCLCTVKSHFKTYLFSLNIPEQQN